MFVSDTEK
ncbi:MAG: hypothetical protein EZS28_055527, partial [Streblomastix strix]